MIALLLAASLAQPPLGDLPAFTVLLREAEGLGVPVVTAETATGTDAFTDYERIVLGSHLSPEQRLCALAHELAHVALGPHEPDAYFVGLTTCRALGIEDGNQWWGGVRTSRTDGPVTEQGRAYAAALASRVTARYRP